MPLLPLLGLFLLLAPLFLLLSNNKRVISSESRLPPSPPKLPFIGNLHQLGSLPHRSLRALSEKHGPLMLLQLGRVPTLVVSSPRMAQEILRTHDLVFASRPSLKAIQITLRGSNDLGFAPYGEYWRQTRRMCVTHLFSPKMVQSFRKVREEEVASMIGKISRASSIGLVNMSEILISLTSSIICRIVLGKFSQKEGRYERMHELMEETSVVLGAVYAADYFPKMAWLDVLLGMDARAKRNAERWDDVLEEVFENQNHVDQSKDDEAETNTNFIDVLLSLRKESNEDFALGKDEIKALLQDLFIGGTDTTYITLEWSLVELVRNTEAMKQLQDEVNAAGITGMIKEEDLSRMSYLKAVIKEVLRLHPQTPLLIPRESMDDCRIEGYEIPKKTRVFVNVWAIGRDPKFWEAPDEFRPERFIGSSVDFRGSDFQFIPFGAGRRICPGMIFATSILELALANLVSRFDWELPGGMTSEDLDMDEAPGIIIRRKERLHLTAKLRSD